VEVSAATLSLTLFPTPIYLFLMSKSTELPAIGGSIRGFTALCDVPHEGKESVHAGSALVVSAEKDVPFICS
jgi:hypothetical protein